MTTVDVMPKPNQRMNSGISASLGTTWLTTTYGSSRPRSHADSAIATPAAKPMVQPAATPSSRSSAVARRCGQK